MKQSTYLHLGKFLNTNLPLHLFRYVDEQVKFGKQTPASLLIFLSSNVCAT